MHALTYAGSKGDDGSDHETDERIQRSDEAIIL